VREGECTSRRLCKLPECSQVAGFAIVCDQNIPTSSSLKCRSINSVKRLHTGKIESVLIISGD
jgi:hypothetical protein